MRTGAGFLGLALAAATAGITAIDTHSRSVYAQQQALVTQTAVTAAPRVVLDSPATTSPDEGDAVARCGIERWDVKTAVDLAARRIDRKNVKQTTIAALDAIPAPPDPVGRVAPVEETVYELTATITAYKVEPDSDYHLALADDQGRTMIAEIPAPTCVSGGRFRREIAQARAAFDSRFQAGTRYQGADNTTVTIRGVGFFDRIHGQRGVAPNGIELHPVLSLSFVSG